MLTMALFLAATPSVTVANDKLELTVMTDGGALSSLVRKDDPARTNPLWEGFGGTGRGHFTCVDGFGGGSAEEKAAGLPGHGEAHRLPWQTQADRNKLTQTVKLPVVQETLTRTIELVDGESVVYVHNQLESHLGFDRPIVWAEHATVGSPFLETAVVDLSAGRCHTRPHPTKPQDLPRRLASDRDFIWPMAPSVTGPMIDLRPPGKKAIDHLACQVDPTRKWGWVTALDTRRKLLVGWVFLREQFPWVQNWGHYPDGKLARGLEFSTQPFDIPRREAVQMKELFGTPTFRWLPAKSTIEGRYLVFYTPAEGFARVDDVRVEEGRIVVEDRKAGKTITLAASRASAK